jgi:hypothetical protein
MTDTSFETIYADLKDELQGSYAGRAKASRSGAIWLITGLAATAVLAFLLHTTTLWPYVAVFGVLLSIWLASRPMRKLTGQIKHPVLEAIARRSGMTYQPSGFTPAGSAEAHKALFAGAGQSTYTDCFSGERDGRAFAIYEASLSQKTGGQGDMAGEMFKGQIYWFRRRSAVSEMAIVPDRGVFRFFKPAKGLELVKFPDDAEFEKRFDVYAADEAQAREVLTAQVRRQLLDWRGKEPLFAHLKGEEALVAINGKDLFEPTLRKKTTPEETARGLYNDEQACTAQLAELDTALG